ncbi:MAG: hypothetical protein LLF92_05145 [Planctomycetaceae bacterium]|nr:hypothetical protein [Planctomycetaceae bacterium]
MEIAKQYLLRYHHRMGFVGISLLMLPILILVWLVAKEPFISVFNGTVPGYIFSGRIFSERFNIIHAGTALDQPTTGKWLFWFSVMTLSSLSYIKTIKWFSNTKNSAGYITMCIFSGIICLLLLCILSWPLIWLIQYIHSMGFTYRRVFGLICAITGGVIAIRFMYKTIKTT